MSVTQGIWKAQCGGPSPATPVYTLYASVPATQASAPLGVSLPKGAVVMAVNGIGGGTGGTSPTIHIGTEADPDAYAADLAADVASFHDPGAYGDEMGVRTTEVTPLYGGVGTSAATGGAVEVWVYFVL